MEKNHLVTIISSIYRFNDISPFAHKILRILTKPIQFLLTLLLGIFHRSYIFTTSPVSFSIRQKWLARGWISSSSLLARVSLSPVNLCTLVFRHRWASTGSHSWNLNILSLVSSSQKNTREATAWNSSLLYLFLLILPPSFYSYSPFFFLFTSLFLFRRTFSNLPPSYFARNFLPLLSSFSYFLNYPRGFDPSFDSSFLSFSFLFFFWRFLGSYVSFSFQFTFDLATSWKRLASFSLSPQRRFSPSFRPRSTTLSVTFSFQRSSLKPLPYATRFLDETFYPRIPDSIREISDPFRIFFRILSRNQGITSEKIVEILKNYIYIHIIESLNKVIESKSIRWNFLKIILRTSWNEIRIFDLRKNS